MIHWLFAIIRPFRKAYWFLVRPDTRGAKCIIIHDNKVLMVRNTYGKRYWTFPGGYVERHEEPESAARREAREEVNVEVGPLRYLGNFSTDREYKHDTVYCFVAHVTNDAFTIDPIEIAEAAWFSFDALPDFRGQYANRIIEMYKSTLKI
jgi:8-oxo-dGTP pyrophosphatase MutT (NUDIX family)